MRLVFILKALFLDKVVVEYQKHSQRVAIEYGF